MLHMNWHTAKQWENKIQREKEGKAQHNSQQIQEAANSSAYSETESEERETKKVCKNPNERMN